MWEEAVQLDEIKDEDGFPGEDIHELTNWVRDTFWRVLAMKEYEILAVNFSAYGASELY